MNFYTLTSRANIRSKKWLKLLFIFTFIFSLIIFSVNFIVDPYNITKYNLLKIKFKFARDDRTEKINYFTSLTSFENILLGSSRVYSINPKTVTALLGENTYNFGVGTATVEDHLGILLYLKREKKLPKNLILGVDFYTFNPDIPPNKYFITNKNLNFLSYSNYEENYLSKFFSIDSFRASFKTLTNHLKSKNEEPRFDTLGWAGVYEDYSKRDIAQDLVKVKKELHENISDIYSNLKYKFIDTKRVNYYNQIKKICKENDIQLYIFTTPLHPELLNILNNNENTKNALQEFVSYLSSFEHFYNTYNDELLYNDLRNFHGTTHSSTNAGDIIVKKLLQETP